MRLYLAHKKSGTGRLNSLAGVAVARLEGSSRDAGEKDEHSALFLSRLFVFY